MSKLKNEGDPGDKPLFLCFSRNELAKGLAGISTYPFFFAGSITPPTQLNLLNQAIIMNKYTENLLLIHLPSSHLKEKG